MKILLDNGHGEDTPGKRSPDGLFREYSYARMISREIESELKSKGYDVDRIVKEESDIPLSERVKRVNDRCRKYGAKNVVLISIHCNAAGKGKWMNARGWCAFTSRGQTKSDELATLLYIEAQKNFRGHQIRKDYSDGDMDWEAGFYILKHTQCPAVLTENFFQDNKEDVSYLLSLEGKKQIVKTHVDAIISYVEKNK